MVNVRNLDLNLLRVFEAIYVEGGITKAANKLGLSQPAASNALSRLREHIGDQLFLRTVQGVEPTAEAKRIAPTLIATMKALEQTLSTQADFDPDASQREFGIIMSDAVEAMIMHPLIRAAMQNAPGITYDLRSIDPGTLRESIFQKQVDIGIFVTPINDDHIRSSHLVSTVMSIVVRADHPVYGGRATLSEDDFFNADWVLINSDLRRASNFHREVKAKGRKRRIVCKASRMMSVPYIIAESDLMGILPRSMAEGLADRLNLKIFDIPFKVPPEAWYMIWHQDFTDDPAHRWLREQMELAVADISNN